MKSKKQISQILDRLSFMWFFCILVIWFNVYFWTRLTYIPVHDLLLLYHLFTTKLYLTTLDFRILELILTSLCKVTYNCGKARWPDLKGILNKANAYLWGLIFFFNVLKDSSLTMRHASLDGDNKTLYMSLLCMGS